MYVRMTIFWGGGGFGISANDLRVEKIEYQGQLYAETQPSANLLTKQRSPQVGISSLSLHFLFESRRGGTNRNLFLAEWGHSANVITRQSPPLTHPADGHAGSYLILGLQLTNYTAAAVISLMLGMPPLHDHHVFSCRSYSLLLMSSPSPKSVSSCPWFRTVWLNWNC